MQAIHSRGCAFHLLAFFPSGLGLVKDRLRVAGAEQLTPYLYFCLLLAYVASRCTVILPHSCDVRRAQAGHSKSCCLVPSSSEGYPSWCTNLLARHTEQCRNTSQAAAAHKHARR